MIKLFAHFHKLELQTRPCHPSEGINTTILYCVYVRVHSTEVSFVDATSNSRYSLEPYGLVQPLQVREALKASRDHGEYIRWWGM